MTQINTIEIETESETTIDDIKFAFDKLLDIAEECYPRYYSCDSIARILDTYKSIFDSDFLRCTNPLCREAQADDGEFCEAHSPSEIEKGDVLHDIKNNVSWLIVEVLEDSYRVATPNNTQVFIRKANLSEYKHIKN